ncbi:hypothetical protein P7C73_g2262, partial [Tremellales sp. Uapishka_1]
MVTAGVIPPILKASDASPCSVYIGEVMLPSTPTVLSGVSFRTPRKGKVSRESLAYDDYSSAPAVSSQGSSTSVFSSPLMLKRRAPIRLAETPPTTPQSSPTRIRGPPPKPLIESPVDWVEYSRVRDDDVGVGDGGSDASIEADGVDAQPILKTPSEPELFITPPRRTVSKINLPILHSQSPSLEISSSPTIAVNEHGKLFVEAILHSSDEDDECGFTSDSSHEVVIQEMTLRVEACVCDACGRGSGEGRMMKILPCGDVACSQCFSSSLAAVSVSQGPTKCAACMQDMQTFKPWEGSVRLGRNGPMVLPKRPIKKQEMEETVVMRIDNVAWDITPNIVEAFLPLGVLPKDHPQPVHILLDRYDGRTKDYIKYIEAASKMAAREILKHRQNRFMPGGKLGHKRPVTITQVDHSELVDELRPQTAQELQALLMLCQAAVISPPASYSPSRTHQSSTVAPNGVTHFLKSRHGPYYALMSIMTRLRGKESPAYWDIFQVAAGAIACLAMAMARKGSYKSTQHFKTYTDPEDAAVFDKLTKLYSSCFGFQLPEE